MKIIYSSKFAKNYKKLPNKTKLLAEKREKIFRENIYDPRLKTHRLTGKLSGFWSFSIDYKTRIIFEIRSENEIWFLTVGSHDQVY